MTMKHAAFHEAVNPNIRVEVLGAHFTGVLQLAQAHGPMALVAADGKSFLFHNGRLIGALSSCAAASSEILAMMCEPREMSASITFGPDVSSLMHGAATTAPTIVELLL